MTQTALTHGVLVLVVGPSGAGKDTLIAAAKEQFAGDVRLQFPRRLVTRPAGLYEDHASIDAADFARLATSDGFALHWQAHGLGYGVPAAIGDALGKGAIVVCNASR